MKPMVIAGIAGLMVGLLFLKRRGRKKTTMQKIQHRAEDVIEDLDHRVVELRDEARRFSGEARQRLQDQAHDLEAQQRELKKRLNEISTDAQKLLEKARAKAHI